MKVGGIRMKILFVGNSHTYMNDMPEMVRINSSEKLEVTMLARPAITFHDHLESMELQFALKQGYDFVIFQQAAHEPCPSKEATLHDAKALIELARSCGVMPYIMIPWSQRNYDDDFKTTKDIYHQVMMDNLVDGIPVGYVINRLSHQNPELELFQSDNHHLTSLGSYLESITILNTIFFETKFPGKLIYPNQSSFEEHQLDERLIDFLTKEVVHIVERFKSNYCVCGKREILDD